MWSPKATAIGFMVSAFLTLGLLVVGGGAGLLGFENVAVACVMPFVVAWAVATIFAVLYEAEKDACGGEHPYLNRRL